MNESVFNPEAFLMQETTDSLESKYTPVPEGEHKALVLDVTSDVSSKKQAPYLNVTFDILDENLRAQFKQEHVRVSNTYWLDLNSSGALEIGPNKNVKLGQLREALGQNVSGQAWSPLMMKGCGPIVIRVTQEKDQQDPEIIRNRVTGVTRG